MADKFSTEFDRECIAESQRLLFKDKHYIALRDKIKKIRRHVGPKELAHCFLNYEIGFLCGEAYERVKSQKMDEMLNESDLEMDFN